VAHMTEAAVERSSIVNLEVSLRCKSLSTTASEVVDVYDLGE
jgi:hypothetical protein